MAIRVDCLEIVGIPEVAAVRDGQLVINLVRWTKPLGVRTFHALTEVFIAAQDVFTQESPARCVVLTSVVGAPPTRRLLPYAHPSIPTTSKGARR